MRPDEESLRELETSLWLAETRFDRAYMERMLAPEFFEFGRSGRVYDRAACLDMLAGPLDAELREIAIRFPHPDVALVSFVSVVRSAAVEYANRSSLWTRTESGWQLRFHQGTPRPSDARSKSI